MDLHDHFKAWLSGENLSPADVSLALPSVKHQLERIVEQHRRTFYAGAQAALNVMVEVGSKKGLDAADVSTAMIRLQRQATEGQQ
jgi:hypothetical protein